LFPVVNVLKCVVREVILFSIVAFKTHDMSQGIDFDSGIILQIG